LRKSAADGHRMLCEAYGEHAPSIKTCEYWFRRFKSGDFDTSDKAREGRPVQFEDAELEALLNQDSCQTQEELAETLGVTQQAISNRLKAMGMVQKQGNWVPYELKPRDVDVFIDGACSPYASHSIRCPSAALFLKLKQKSSTSRKWRFPGTKVDMVKAQRKYVVYTSAT